MPFRSYRKRARPRHDHPGSQWLRAFIDIRADVAEASATFWSAALGWELAEHWPGHPEFRSFEPPTGDAYVHQQVGDHGPRIHFDLEIADEAEIQQLVGLGATVVGEGAGWYPMASPGGLPFCLVHRRDHVRPFPAVGRAPQPARPSLRRLTGSAA